MAELKTRITDRDPADFIAGIADADRRRDCETLAAMMERITAAPARMWGASMVGYGVYKYRYESGREGEWFVTGFAPRKGDLTIYLMTGFDLFPGLMDRLGKYRIGKSCLYVKRLEDVDMRVLETLLRKAVEKMTGRRTDLPPAAPKAPAKARTRA